MMLKKCCCLSKIFGVRNSGLISNFERKLIQEMIQPGGATKKPQEGLLKTFAKNCENLEPSTIFSIMYYVLGDKSISWISKYVF